MRKACLSSGEEREKAKEEVSELLKYLENEVKGKKFFGGETIGLVDITANIVGYWFGVIAELAAIEILREDEFPNLCKWMEEYTNSSFVKENLPPKDKLREKLRARFQAPGHSK